MLLQRKRPQAGFTMVELLVVVGLIGLMAAVALPGIARYIRTYRVRGAASDVATALQQARMRAISNNVNYGVLFVALSSNTYRVVREDIPGRSMVADQPSLQTELLQPPLVNEQASQLYQLPQDVVFATTTAQCPELAGVSGTAFTPDTLTKALRFNRLGAVCRAGTSVFSGDVCNPVDAGLAVFWNRGVSHEVGVCVLEQRTGLTRTVVIKPGGRILVVQRAGAESEANQ